MTGTERDAKEEKIQHGFLSALEPEATHQKTRTKYQIQLEKIKTDKLINL